MKKMRMQKKTSLKMKTAKPVPVGQSVLGFFQQSLNVPGRGNRLMRLNVLLGHMSSYEFIDIARLWPRRLRDVRQGNVVRPTRLSRAADFGSVEVACLYSFLPMLYPKLFKVFKAMQELTVAQSIS